METDFKKYGQNFQLVTLSLLIHDKIFFYKIKDILESEYFDNKYTQTICNTILEYGVKYNCPPKSEDVKALLEISFSTSSKLYLLTLDNILKVDLSNRQFVEEQVVNFCFTRYALTKAEEERTLLTLGKFDEARSISLSKYKAVNSGCEEFNLTQDFGCLTIVKKEEDSSTPLPWLLPTFTKKTKGGSVAGNLIVVVGQSSLGKCFAKGTRIRMFDSSVKCVEDVKPGDKLMGWDGQERIVDTLASGTEQMYRVKQQHGRDYVVNESHILCLQPIPNYIKYYPLSTNELVTITVKDYLKKSKTWKKGHRGFSSSVEYTSREVKIDPYFLGLWLGDGESAGTTIYGVDLEIKNYLKEYATKLNLKFTEKEDSKNCKRWALNNQQGLNNILLDNLRHYNLIKNKHIPDDYLYNSREVRLQLLAGLLDTDGYLETETKSCFEITQKRKDLAEQIYLLARSLGFQVKYTTSHAFLYKKDCGEVHTSYISRGIDKIPTRLKRKQAKSSRSVVATLTQIEVIKENVDTYYGFTLKEDSRDRMFLLEDYTVVHNTNYLVAQARHLVQLGKKVLYFTLEIEGEQIISRAVAGMTNINQEDLLNHPQLIKQKIDRITEIKSEIKIIRLKSTSARVEVIQSKVEEVKSQGFFPDTIMIDGINQVKLPKGYRAVDTNDKFEYIAEELRDLALEEKVPVYGAFQSNRGGFNVEYADEQNIGKAIEVYQVCDIMVMLTQTETMLENNQCYAQLLKNRRGPKGIMLRLSYDPNLCTFIELEEVIRSTLINSKNRQEISKGLETVQRRLDTARVSK